MPRSLTSYWTPPPPNVTHILLPYLPSLDPPPPSHRTHLKRELAQHPEAPLEEHGLVCGHVQLVHGLLERRVCVLVGPELDAMGFQLPRVPYY